VPATKRLFDLMTMGEVLQPGWNLLHVSASMATALPLRPVYG
jgi:hypothetical protein